MKDYFSILGISPTASREEIKRAYRRKALQYHPDRNPDPGAQAKFIEITEAYEMLISGEWEDEYLSKPGDIQQPRRGRRGPMSEQEFEERLRKAKEMARRKAKIEYEEFTSLKQSWIYRIYPYMAAIYMLFAVSLIIDYFSAEPEYLKVVDEEVVDSWLHIYVEDGDHIRLLNLANFDWRVYMDDEVLVYRTQLYDQVQHVRFTSIGQPYGTKFANYRSIHVGLWYILIVMFLPALTFFYIGPKPQFYFLLHLNTYLPAATIIILVILHYKFFIVS